MNNTGPGPTFALPTAASAARLYDFYLGGKNNYPVDRDLAAQIETQVPEIKPMARANRRFLSRVVDHMAAQGIDQFLDIGSGLPAENPVHEVARRHHPGARVVYIDYDPTVRVHAEALLAEDPDITGVVQADMREPEAVFAHRELTDRLDLERPVGLLLVAMLHFLTDEEDPAGLLHRYLDHLPTDSFVAISHVESDTAPERAAALERLYGSSTSALRARSHTEIARFFDELDLVDPPGLAHIGTWHSRPIPKTDDGPPIPPEQAWGLGGLARLTHRH
ncbi:SAM-dependent methyltransferase [Streptomonospora algeriensis]|uniref:SAM-dependent methyltransferase n=1 Tax=Streptomonospora algeriensis TaxID=995084 RepID=A0ABW3B9U5_9ACTN